MKFSIFQKFKIIYELCSYIDKTYSTLYIIIK